MLKDAMTGHLTRCSGTDPRNLPTSASAAKSKGFFRCVLKLYSRPPWTRSVTEPIRAQTAGQKLAADNQAIEAQQQLLQNLYQKRHSPKDSRTNKVRPRSRTQKAHDVQQTCDFASMEAQFRGTENVLSVLKRISECK